MLQCSQYLEMEILILSLIFTWFGSLYMQHIIYIAVHFSTWEIQHPTAKCPEFHCGSKHQPKRSEVGGIISV